MFATVTGGTIIGYVILAICLLLCLGAVVLGAFGVYERDRTGWAGVAGGILGAAVVLGCWWWGMAFTLSSDYHAWNVKEGKVDRVAKRLVSTGDKGVGERYVVTIDGQPYGIDDTRAALVRPGDTVSLRCKKDFQWGVPREAHGWVCRWNKVPGL